MEQKIYFRLKSRYLGEVDQTIRLKNVAQLICTGIPVATLEDLPISKLTKQDKTLKVIDAMEVVRKIKEQFPHVDIEVIGSPETVVHVQMKKRKWKVLLFPLVWLLLFIGAGLTVMNFHEDVSMRQVHIKLHEMITGEYREYPLWLQIPYSIGLGLGMILFFNHVFKKRINEEPSPLELEMFNYEENIDRYVSIHENEAWKKDQ